MEVYTDSIKIIKNNAIDAYHTNEKKMTIRSDNKGISYQEYCQIYQEHFAIAINIVYRITHNYAIAEEICQDAFILLHQRLADMNDKRHAIYWVYLVGKNYALNYLRKQKREQKAYQKAMVEIQPIHITGEDKLLHDEINIKMQNAISKLPDKLRMPLLLSEYGEMPYKKIANILNITEGNVKVRIFRAREKLAKSLQKEKLNEHG